MLFFAAVQHSDGSLSFLVETSPPESQWGKEIRDAGNRLECASLKEMYLASEDRPDDYPALYAYAFGRGYLRRKANEDYPYEVSLLRRQGEGLSYVRQEVNLLTRLIEACGAETPAGYQLADIRVLGEKLANEGVLSLETSVA